MHTSLPSSSDEPSRSRPQRPTGLEPDGLSTVHHSRAPSSARSLSQSDGDAIGAGAGYLQDEDDSEGFGDGYHVPLYS